MKYLTKIAYALVFVSATSACAPGLHGQRQARAEALSTASLKGEAKLKAILRAVGDGSLATMAPGERNKLLCGSSDCSAPGAPVAAAVATCQHPIDAADAYWLPPPHNQVINGKGCADGFPGMTPAYTPVSPFSKMHFAVHQAYQSSANPDTAWNFNWNFADNHFALTQHGYTAAYRYLLSQVLSLMGGDPRQPSYLPIELIYWNWAGRTFSADLEGTFAWFGLERQTPAMLGTWANWVNELTTKNVQAGFYLGTVSEPNIASASGVAPYVNASLSAAVHTAFRPETFSYVIETLKTARAYGFRGNLYLDNFTGAMSSYMCPPHAGEGCPYWGTGSDGLPKYNFNQIIAGFFDRYRSDPAFAGVSLGVESITRGVARRQAPIMTVALSQARVAELGGQSFWRTIDQWKPEIDAGKFLCPACTIYVLIDQSGYTMSEFADTLGKVYAWGGIPILSTTTLIEIGLLKKGHCPGDVANVAGAIGKLDGYVDIADLNAIVSNWNAYAPSSNPTLSFLDLDHNGRIDIGDLNQVLLGMAQCPR